MPYDAAPGIVGVGATGAPPTREMIEMTAKPDTAKTAILAAIREGASTYKQIMAATGLTKTTVIERTRDLHKAGKIDRLENGRNVTFVYINRTAQVTTTAMEKLMSIDDTLAQSMQANAEARAAADADARAADKADADAREAEHKARKTVAHPPTWPHYIDEPPASSAPAEAAQVAGEPAPAETAPTTAPAPTAAHTRLTKGVAEQRILAYLAAHPDKEFGPYDLARAIDARGVRDLMARLASQGKVRQTRTERPLRYAAITAPAPADGDAETATQPE